MERVKIPLSHGTLLLMEGATQADWQVRAGPLVGTGAGAKAMRRGRAAPVQGQGHSAAAPSRVVCRGGDGYPLVHNDERLIC